MFVVTKRRNPFGEAREVAKAANTTNMSVYEDTVVRMMAASREAYAQDAVRQHTSSDSSSVCAACRAPSHYVCSFCGHMCCESCIRQCEECQDLFCRVCSTLNYDLNVDRVFCLECHANVCRPMHPTGPTTPHFVMGNPSHTSVSSS